MAKKPTAAQRAERKEQDKNSLKFLKDARGYQSETKVQTDIKVVRPAGRSSNIERNIINSLAKTVKIMQEWMRDNDRIATGRSISSFKINIIRQPRLDRNLGSLRRQGRNTGKEAGKQFSDNTKELQSLFNTSDIGLVTGQILGAPSVQYALQGRGPGAAPPVSVIERWMAAKKLVPSWRNAPYLIARKIGEEGTQGPHFDQQVLTTITKASTAKLVQNIGRLFGVAIGGKYKNHLIALLDIVDNMSDDGSLIDYEVVTKRTTDVLKGLQ